MSDDIVQVWADRRKVGTIHMLKDRKGVDIIAKCGKKTRTIVENTVWWGQVNCPACRALMAPTHPFDGVAPSKPKLKLRKKKSS